MFPTKSVSGSLWFQEQAAAVSDADLVPVHVSGGLSLQTFLLSRGPATQQAQINRTEADSRFSLVMRHHENVFPRLALVFGAYFEHNEPRYRLSTRLILRMGLPGPLSGDPMLFLLSLVGDGGAGFPICKQTNKQTKTQLEPVLSMTTGYLTSLCPAVATRN